MIIHSVYIHGSVIALLRRQKVLACRNTPLHGRAGDVGILECSQLVAELDKMKNSQSQHQQTAKTEGEVPSARSAAADEDSMLTLGEIHENTNIAVV